jgi:hypothetical protein
MVTPARLCREHVRARASHKHKHSHSHIRSCPAEHAASLNTSRERRALQWMNLFRTPYPFWCAAQLLHRFQTPSRSANATLANLGRCSQSAVTTHVKSRAPERIQPVRKSSLNSLAIPASFSNSNFNSQYIRTAHTASLIDPIQGHSSTVMSISGSSRERHCPNTPYITTRPIVNQPSVNGPSPQPPESTPLPQTLPAATHSLQTLRQHPSPYKPSNTELPRSTRPTSSPPRPSPNF